MKKIVNGRKYDTETAALVGNWCNGFPRSDFRYRYEALYRKRTGEYFLRGAGRHGSGDAIVPLSDGDARKWVEGHLEVGEYEREFGEVAE